jgi:FdhD protein
MIPRRSIKQIAIQKVRNNNNKVTRYQDILAVEEPLEIRLGLIEDGRRLEKSISLTMRTPGDDFELAAGFLFSEGIIQNRDEIEQISYCVGLEKEKQQYNVVSVQLRSGVDFDPDRLLRHFYTTSSCGVCGKASLEALQIRGCPTLPKAHPIISAKVISELTAKLRQAQSVFEKTGGLHAAALFDASGNLISLREDVGRHNAVDKLIGEQLLAHKIPLFDYLMLVSGRAGFEIVQKALMAGIPMVAAVGAPSSLAVDLAREFGMTLLGFVRDESFNIYTGDQRVQFNTKSA